MKQNLVIISCSFFLHATITPMDSRYNHTQYEKKIYQLWEKHKCFNPDEVKKLRQKNIVSASAPLASTLPTSSTAPNAAVISKPTASSPPFTIIMPPPNANDPLHVGHAMFVALEDILIRYHRMLGDDTLWLPGTDHAGIETQFVFEKKLRKQKKSRFKFDRKTLYKMIWDYVQENSRVATSQIKKLGASADWSRFCFTLDTKIVDTVLNTFEKLNSKGLVYRSNRLVNYCTKCGTAFSNLEVNHVENITKLYYIKYGPFTLATTRPETKFADTAVAVHPDDKRYQKYIGKKIKCEGLLGKFKLKVIADKMVDPEFGTGVVKITPYHDFNDFEAWQRHKNEMPAPKQVIGYDGKLTKIAEHYAGLKVNIARKKIVADLEKKGLLVKIKENYQNNIGVCYRCKSVIEPLPLPQFYIKVKPLTKPILKALDKKEIRVHGAGHDKTLKHWLEILEDWNISRQIVWGIRMPVWYEVNKNPDLRIIFINKNDEKVFGSIQKLLQNYSLKEIKQGLQSLTAPEKASFVVKKADPSTAKQQFFQETDTFDTWFSSSQWPFITLQNTKPGDFDRFYPTQVMETGYDILPFWVMRMLMVGNFMTGKMPFKDIYLHGLIRDSKGQKMSKSKGNVINPLEITSTRGADALRLALVIRSTPGLDKSVGDPDFKAARNFTNKLWNAARFVLNRLKELPTNNTEADEQFTKKLNQLNKQITRQLNNFQLGLAAETLYNEFWHWYCDECIEAGKQGKLSKNSLLNGLVGFLKLLHPFAPFITEAIWQELVKQQLVDEPLLVVSNWPTT